MPRMYVQASDDWRNDGCDEREPKDYCRSCWPYKDDDGDDHPSFADTEYVCEVCGRDLKAIDD